jgi:hypothetical protein
VAAAGLTDDALRQLLTLVLGGVLALGAATLIGRPRWSLLAWPGVLVSTLTIVITASGRVHSVLTTGPSAADWRLEAWLLPAAWLLIVVGGLIIRATPARAVDAVPPVSPVAGRGVSRGFGYGLVGLALLGILLAETSALSFAPYADARAFALIGLFAVLHVLLRWFDHSRAGNLLAWSTIVAGLLALVAGLGRDLVDPIELGSIPLGLALVAGELIAFGLIGSRPALVGTVGTGATGTTAGMAGTTAATRAPSALLTRQVALAGGLAIALLPSVFVGAEGTLVRPVLTLGVGGALGILGALLLTRTRWSVLAWPVSIVGTVTVLLTAAVQIVPLYDGPAGPTGALEAWLIPAALLLVATGACLVWTTWISAPRNGAETAAGNAARAGASAGASGDAPVRPPGGAPVGARMGAPAGPPAGPPMGSPTGAPMAAPANASVNASAAGHAGPEAATRTPADRAVSTGYGLIIAALVGVVLAEGPALDYAPLAMIRVVLVVWLFSALYLGVFWADESRMGRLLAWVAIGGAAVMVVAGWTRDVPDPVEIVSIPLALALVASGLLHLDRFPAARSWRSLAPGLLVLLLPSLYLDLTFSPLWRVVGLGVLAIAVLVLGTVRRLQAPFLIGAVVLLVHALAQLWPWISLAYGVIPWWLWLGVGGVLLIVLAARYEQRIQNLKSVALRISALR